MAEKADIRRSILDPFGLEITEPEPLCDGDETGRLFWGLGVVAGALHLAANYLAVTAWQFDDKELARLCTTVSAAHRALHQAIHRLHDAPPDRAERPSSRRAGQMPNQRGRR